MPLRCCLLVFAIAVMVIATTSCDETSVAAADAQGDAPEVDAGIDARGGDASVLFGSRCEAPLTLSIGEEQAGNNTYFPIQHASRCSNGTSVSPEVIYAIDVGSAPVDLLVTATVDESPEAPFDVVLSLRSTCDDADTELVCTDNGWGESLEALAVSDPLYLFVDGTYQYGGLIFGAYTLTSRTRPVAAVAEPCDPDRVTNRCATGLRCEDAVCVPDNAELACGRAIDVPTSSVFRTAQTTYKFHPSYHTGSCAADPDNALPEHLYRLVLEQASRVRATTDFEDTSFDTMIYLREGSCSGVEIACADDIDLTTYNARTVLTQELAAGTYFLVVDGSAATPGYGHYTLEIAVEPLLSP